VNGFLYALLTNQIAPQTYEFCLKISTSLNFITVPNLKFFLEASCSKDLSKVNSSVMIFDQMYSSTLVRQKLFGVSQIVVIADPVHCPITFVSIRRLGCVLPYQGNVLSLNSDNDTLATRNSSLQVEQLFCVEVTNKDQVLTFDNIKYT